MKTSRRFLFSLIGLLVGIFILSYYSKVSKVECWVDGVEQNDSLVCKQLQSLVGGKLLFRDLFSDEEVLSATIINETKEVFSLEKTKSSLSGKIIFYLKQTPPLYRVLINGEKKLFTVSGEDRSDDERVVVPTLVDEQGLFISSFEENHKFLSKFLEVLEEDIEHIKEIYFLSNSKIRLLVDGFPDFILDPNQNPEIQANKFKRIYHDLKPSEVDILLKEIDLRFELPVLRTYESSDSAELLIDSQE